MERRLAEAERQLEALLGETPAATTPEERRALRRARKARAKEEAKVDGAAKSPTKAKAGRKDVVDVAPSTIPAEPLSASDAEFVERAEDPTVGLVTDFTADSDTVLMAFGGMALQIGMPPFEFFSLTGGMPAKRLFIRDVHQAWYQRGVPGHGDTIDDLAARLRELLDEARARRLVVAGNSAGGYGALLFGTLLGADRVLAFSPQTFLDQDALWAIGDHRWDVKLRRLEAAGGADPRFVDLGASLPELANGRTRYDVHYAATLMSDEHHAERVAGIPGLTLHGHPRGGHSVIRLLRRTGELEQLIIDAITFD